MQAVKYPIYLYHKEYDDPRKVDNSAEEVDLKNKGWVRRYIWKEYPKMVNGVLVNSAADEKLLRNAGKKKPKVKITQVGAGTDRTVDDDIVLEPPLKGSVQVPENLETEEKEFEIVNSDGVVIPDLQFSSWRDAQQRQKELNKNSPGHVARKILKE